jgi:hypothetical protein
MPALRGWCALDGSIAKVTTAGLLDGVAIAAPAVML